MEDLLSRWEAAEDRVKELEDAMTKIRVSLFTATSAAHEVKNELYRYKDALERIKLREENEGRPDSFIANICKGALGS